MQCSSARRAPQMEVPMRCWQDLVGDRRGAKEKGWAMSVFLTDFVVSRSKEGKQRWRSEEWEMSC